MRFEDIVTLDANVIRTMGKLAGGPDARGRDGRNSPFHVLAPFTHARDCEADLVEIDRLHSVKLRSSRGGTGGKRSQQRAV